MSTQAANFPITRKTKKIHAVFPSESYCETFIIAMVHLINLVFRLGNLSNSTYRLIKNTKGLETMPHICQCDKNCSNMQNNFTNCSKTRAFLFLFFNSLSIPLKKFCIVEPR